jgi:hypothetical protein
MMFLAFSLEDVAIALTIFIFVFTAPTFRSFAKGNWRIKNPNHDQALYEDEDGAASTESTEQFSNKLQFIVILALALIGLGLSIANAIFTTIQKSRIASQGPNLVAIFLLVPAWVRTHLFSKTDETTC